MLMYESYGHALYYGQITAFLEKKNDLVTPVTQIEI